MNASFRQLFRHNRGRNSRRAPWALPAIAGCSVILACILGSHSATAAGHASPATSHGQLQAARASADPHAQRAHAWQTLLSMVTREGATPTSPAFTRWHNEVATFDPSPSPGAAPFPGLPVTTRAGAENSSTTLAGGPLMTFIHYNPAAHDHIRHHRLYRQETLDALLAAAADAGEPHSIPPLPREAAVAMTAWWPVASRQPTPIPVWDPERQARSEGANGYLSWPRVLALVACPASAATRPLVFAGRTHPDARPARLEQFFHRPVDASLAAQLMANARFRNAAMIALGRPLAAGDFLALVGLHLMTAELDTGVWATYWWHDRPDSGPFAAGRPAQLPPPWNHYLMDVTLDAQRPLEADGSPNICFNPWFDATFPDIGEGSGVQANCLSCHQRAAYPVTRTMRVTRGTPGATASNGQLATALLWSIAKTGRIQGSEEGE